VLTHCLLLVSLHPPQGKKKKKSKEPPPIDHPSFVDAAQVVELKKAWDNFSIAKEGAHGLHIMTG
jgi:hypothetical protein